MKILTRKKIGPFRLSAGDSVELRYRREEDGKIVRDERLMGAPVTRAMTVDEGVIFEDEFEGRATLGAFVMEEKKP